MHENEVISIKTRLKAPTLARITSIFEISAPKLIKVTHCHKFPLRVTIPPPPLVLLDYLLVNNKPDTPTDKQILADLFGECYVYYFGVNSIKPTCVETKPAGQKRRDYVCHLGKKVNSTKFAKRDYSPGRKQPTHPNWSQASIPEWQKYTLGAQAVRKIPEGYVIIEMYTTSRNERHKPVRGGVLINGENYWPVKLKHRSTGHIKWANLHSDDPTVQSIVKETMENAARPNR